MGRPAQPLGTVGKITVDRVASSYVARTRYRTLDGDYHRMEVRGETSTQASNELKRRIAEGVEETGSEDITRQSKLTDVAQLWLDEVEDQDHLAPQTFDQYRDSLEGIVLPVLGELRLAELTVGRLDRFLKSEGRTAVSRARRSRVVLSQVLALAVRHEAIPRNPLDGTAKTRRSKRVVHALSLDDLTAIRQAIADWRSGSGFSGPLPDGQLGQIIEVMLGSSARIGETLAIRYPDDVEVDGDVMRITISGTVVPLRGKGLIRQDYPKHTKDWRVVTLPAFSADAVNQPDDRDVACLSVRLTFAAETARYLDARRAWRR